MGKVTELAAGQITQADRITVELHQPPDYPPAVLVRWPDMPSVTSPVRCPAAAVAAIAVLDRAMLVLAEI